MDNDSFYRPAGNVKDRNRTYVPDLYRQVAAEMQEEEDCKQKRDADSTRVVKLQNNRQIVGVLYSISAGIEGELFPVYIGRNIIGSDLSCDICLRETSVSAQHGILLARKQTDENGNEYVKVILSDNDSNYGTIVNGERLNLEKVACTDGDIISIGQNYILVLSLFNAIDKLSVAYGFDRIPEQKISDNRETGSFSAAGHIVGGMPMNVGSDHSNNITQDIKEEASDDFYKPTKQKGEDHYNNKTIIL